jgi:hypothetical protein
MSRILWPSALRGALAVGVLLASALVAAGPAQARTETLSWRAGDAADVITGFRIYVRPEGTSVWPTLPEADVLPTPSSGVYSFDLDVADADSVEVAVSAYNEFGESPRTSPKLLPATSTPPPPPPPPTGTTPVSIPFRMNAGGSAYSDAAGDWVSDADYTSDGSVTTSGLGIGSLDAPLYIYQTERYLPLDQAGPLTFSVPIDDGTYLVRLHEAEIWSGITGPGQRVFDVLAEGALVLDDYDIYATGGFANAVVAEFTVEVTDGSLDLELVRGVQNPRVSGIEILTPDQTEPPPPPPPPPPPEELGQPGQPYLIP